MPDRKQPKGGRIYFGSRFQRYQSIMWGRYDRAAHTIKPGKRRERKRERDGETERQKKSPALRLSLFLLLFHLGLQPMEWCHPHTQGGTSPLFTPLWSCPQTHRACWSPRHLSAQSNCRQGWLSQLSFHSLESIFWSTEVCNFDEVQLICLFSVCLCFRCQIWEIIASSEATKI
jgi:hypothetical protein